MIRLLLLLAGALAAAAAELPAETLARLRAAYVFVHGGSGVVISGDGLVLTNHHVIDDEDREALQVRFADGRRFAAELLGTDPHGDLALLRIADAAPGATFAAVSLAAAGDLRPGIAVWALGNPFGLGDVDDQPTLTRGVLSTGRIVRGSYADAVQTDAPVNPGNSGGPLHDRDGRLLGINGQIRSATGFRVNSGIGLAIAATQIAEFLPLLRTASGGIVRHASAPKGLVLADGEDAPMVRTATGALAAGDLVLAIDGRIPASAEAAMGMFTARAWQPEATAAVRVRRGGAELELALPLRRLPMPGRPWIGWQFAERSIAGSTVVMLTGVDDASPAKRAGLAARTVVRRIAGTAITSRVAMLQTLSAVEAGDDLEVEVEVGGVARRVRIEVGAR